MIFYLIGIALILLVSIYMNKISTKIGLPAVLAFILFGMFLGASGWINDFSVTLDTSETLCSVALVFIMFFGGFGTNWKEARKMAVPSILLSTVGVVSTGVITGLFCHFALQMPILESMLIGAVLSSTDAATVFSILRSRSLSLKYNTASILEVESGSNDPIAYTMTAIFISLLQGSGSAGSIAYMIFAQVVYGFGIGVGIALIGVFIVKRTSPETGAGFRMMFFLAFAMLAYGIPVAVGGNGYLSVYIVGIIMGNAKLKGTADVMNFFDGVTAFMQILIFFLLGMLSTPASFINVWIPAILIAVFLTFVSRPLSVFALMAPFKAKINQMSLVSWSGLRGATSIVFAISATLMVTLQNDIFHIAFLVVLFSMLLQGTLLPLVSKKLNMLDDEDSIARTFTDYMEEAPVQFIQFSIPPEHEWIGHTLKDIILPPETIVVLIKRGNENVIPKGDTHFECDDKVILSAKTFEKVKGIELSEIIVHKDDGYAGRTIADIARHLESDKRIVIIKRGEDVIIPNGDVVLQNDDIVVLSEIENVVDKHHDKHHKEKLI